MEDFPHAGFTSATWPEFCCSSDVRSTTTSSPRAWAFYGAFRALPAVLLALLALGPAPALAATPRDPTLAPNTVIDGPSSDILGLSGMSIARDGTGGLVYLKQVDGVAHVFVSRLLMGSFGAPQQVDAGLAGPSSQPVIAAASPGLLLIAFINGGQLYTVQSTAASPLTAPAVLAGGASNPSLSVSNFGKAYVAFTAAAASGDDVRVAFYYQGQWALIPGPLDVSPGDDAGSGAGRPQVATAGDGEGIVAWGESGHIYARRVWGVSPGLSAACEQADVPSVGGWHEVSADEPMISTGGDSSYAAVVFREVLSNGSQQQSRVLMNRLVASTYTGISPADGLTTPGPEGANQPQVAVNEYGRGFVTSARDQSNQIVAAPLGTNEDPANTKFLNSQPIAAAPDAVPAIAGLSSTLIAWQQAPGSAGPAEIRLRYAADGSDLGPEQVVSSPSLGPTDADSGLAAGGDLSGDAAVAWVQGTGSGTQIVTGQLYQRPGGFAPVKSFSYSTSATPTLAWSPASELWGAPRYTVFFDGSMIANTTATSLQVPAPVPDGRHSWQVQAYNAAGLSSTAAAATVFVDTVAPRVSFVITGMREVGSYLHIQVQYADSPPPSLPPPAASGIKSVQVKWGDGSAYYIAHGKFHSYQRSGMYVVTVIVKDRAGNLTVLTRRIRITPRPRPKPRKPGKPPGGRIPTMATAKAKR